MVLWRGSWKYWYAYVCVCVCVYLQYHEDLCGRLNDMVDATDMLVTEIFQSLNFKLNTGEIILWKNENLE